MKSEMTFDPLTVSLPLYVILIVVEMLAWRFRGLARFEARDTAASLTMGLGAALISSLGASSLIIASFAFFSRFRIFVAPSGALGFVLCLILADFAYYWSHRISHERRWLWASHVVHHSSQHYNLTTALRSPWTDVLSLSFVFYAPICLLGFDPILVFICRGIVVVYQFWFHTETIGRLGILERFIVTPSHHRVHHATNARYLDKNYGGVLILWDRMFGTFEQEDRDIRPVYGIVEPIGVFNPLTIAFHEWISIAKDLRLARSWDEAKAVMFGAPGTFKQL